MDACCQLQKLFQEMQQVQDYLSDINKLLKIDNYGKHLISVEDLLQRHKLVEADIALIGDKVQRVCNDAALSRQAAASAAASSGGDAEQQQAADEKATSDANLITEKINELQVKD